MGIVNKESSVDSKEYFENNNPEGTTPGEINSLYQMKKFYTNRRFDLSKYFTKNHTSSS
jgi:hypothetical protein